MLSNEEAELLRWRASRMLARARERLRDGDYDLAVFLAEQRAQLYLKSVILEAVGEVPRTHSIRELLHIAASVLGKTAAEETREYVRAHRLGLVALEDAYLASMYFPRRYSAEEAEELVRLAEEAVRVVTPRGGEGRDR